MYNLYLISQDKNADYDTYDSAVVVANTEENAKKIHPTGTMVWSDDPKGWYWPDRKVVTFDDTWSSPEYVTVEFIGTTDVLEPGTVVVASFNAG